MDLPLLPTDNLYKFITVLGLIVCAFFAYMAYDESREQEKFAADIMAKQVAFHQEFARAVNRAGAEAPKLLDELDYRGKQGDMIMDGLRSLLAKHSDRFPTVRWYIGFAVCSGLMAVIGFVLWYVRFQRHMDRLVAKGKIISA